MEKLDLKIFENLKQEFFYLKDKETKLKTKDKELTIEDTEELVTKYKEIIEILSKHDLSDLKSNELENTELQEIIELVLKYGEYLNDIDMSIFINMQNKEERELRIQKEIEENILHRYNENGPKIRGVYKEKVLHKNSSYNENAPEFFKKKYPKMFLNKEAPEELKKVFYDSEEDFNSRNRLNELNFQLLKEHPEWKRFLNGKDLSRAFSTEYKELFKILDNDTLLKIGTNSPESTEKMVYLKKEYILRMWCRLTKNRFIPHHVVMLNFPMDEIGDFLLNSGKWQKLMSIDAGNSDDKRKTAILKAAYAMGVFQGDDKGFSRTIKMFTELPKSLTNEEYCKVVEEIDFNNPNKEEQELFGDAYKWGNKGSFDLAFNQNLKKEKKRKAEVRHILEKSKIPRILTPEKAYKIFSPFSMKYDPRFAKFFNDNIEEIVSNQEYIDSIAKIQDRFKDISNINAGKKITLEVAQDYIKTMPYIDVEVGNEELAEKVKIAGYEQEDFNKLQELYNRGKTREFSSIPRIEGQSNEFSYEILRCDDPLTLTIGNLTECCQRIHQAGQTSMEHSMLSPDGRVFCVRDNQGRIVAQSWVWRNTDTICFDSIEISDNIFELYRKQYSNVGQKKLTSGILSAYKKAAQDIMRVDEDTYKRLFKEGIITQEQYNALVLRKITIGMGIYGFISNEIREDKDIYDDKNVVRVNKPDEMAELYTDAGTRQAVIIEKAKKDRKTKQELLHPYQDIIPMYDNSNMTKTVLYTMKRMEQLMGKNRLSHIYVRDGKGVSEEYINEIAKEYEFKPNNTRIMATKNLSIIYSQDNDKIVIGDIFYIPLKQGDEYEKKKFKRNISFQINKALKQLKEENLTFDLSKLDEEQKRIIQSELDSIKYKDEER